MEQFAARGVICAVTAGCRGRVARGCRFSFDLAQEFTERWVHQQQMREAVGRVRRSPADHLPEVLRTFMWAVPHQLGQPGRHVTTLQMTIAGVACWTLSPSGSGWVMDERAAADPTADGDIFARRRVALVHRREHPTGSSRSGWPGSNHRHWPPRARHRRTARR